MRDILILHAGAVGDLVLTAQLIPPLRNVFRSARITVAARCGLVHWLADRHVMDRALDVETIPLHVLYAPKPESSIDWPLSADDLVINCCKGDARFHANLRQSCPARVVTLDPIPSEPRHVTNVWTQSLRDAGIPAEPPSPTQRLITSQFADRTGVIIHPGSGGKAKCAPIETFERIVAHLRKHCVDVRWMIGPTERDWHGHAFKERLEQSAPVIDESDIAIAADHLDHAAAFIGNDAGMTHVAAALGLTTVALFGPTDPTVWSPVGPSVHIRPFPAADEDIAAIVESATGSADHC